LYDILGREITILLNGPLQSGSYEISFDASAFPSGLYFYELTVGDFSETRKMLLIK
jgi:hypothetical protein